MQTANAFVALGGDQLNTVPVFGVTAAEIAVLRAIHGDDAVHDIEPLDDIDRKNRDELARLRDKYKTENARKVMDSLYPGAAARVFEDIDELDLPEELFKRGAPAPKAKVSAKAAKAPPKGRGRKKAGEQPAADTEDEADEDDGVGDTPDSAVFD